ncbi:transcriptional regulator FixK [Anaerotruncus sp. 2789STDY5834896]|uniref:Transcriptional regulator FixK n=2 Tax=Oscillospiraceae TaxID=216572 RepID=A0A1C6INR1_9FIRM|nr:transcriptional regulator FixK [uncultured Anaerotruncus sp.]
MIQLPASAPLFAHIPPAALPALLHCLQAVTRRYRPGQTVLWPGQQVSQVGVVLSGRAHSVKSDITGKEVTITLLVPGSSVGVLLAASGRSSPVAVRAVSDLAVLFFPADRLTGYCGRCCPAHRQLLTNYQAQLAAKAMALHDRNDCLIRPTLRQKVLTYLLQLAGRQRRADVVVPLDRAGMAQYLDADRSALSRELSRMRADGLISFHKDHFQLLGPLAGQLPDQQGR